MERYESLGLVGEGSYGSVLKCRHRDSGRLVAIKKFMDSDDDKTVKKIALREIQLLRQLRHDNLVNLLDVWRRRRRWYLVFEFVERTLLDDLEQNPNGLDLNTSRQILFQVLRAAAFCHQQHIIHRDIKPENILISQGGVVKLCDFGFARTMMSPAEGGAYTDYVATRWYRAPELLVGDTKYGKPVDVWAVGCLLMEILTGQPLFPGDSDLDQIHHIVGCFGNLVAHHQQMFYRNPLFSGVKLPECSITVTLEQRFPSITASALDLAHSCLQMDPERRAQCSELLEHPLFTQDSFHIRVLDELNFKIQKDHRENSTLPKIAKTPRQEKEDENNKNQKVKDKKQSEGTREGVPKEKEKSEKITKPKGKQPSKPSRTNWNTSEPLMMTKPWKTSGAKISDNAARTAATVKSKAQKAAGAEVRRKADVSNPTESRTEKDLKVANMVAYKLPRGKAASSEPKEGSLDMDLKDRESTGLLSGCSDVTVQSLKGIWKPSKPELNQNIRKSCNNNSITKEPRLSKSSTLYQTNTNSTQKEGQTSTRDLPEVAATALTLKISNGDDQSTGTNRTALKMFATLDQQTNHSNMDLTHRQIPNCQEVPSSEASSNIKLQTVLSIDSRATKDATHEPNKSSVGLLTIRDITELLIVTNTQQDSCRTSNTDEDEDQTCFTLRPAANHIDIPDTSGGRSSVHPGCSELCTDCPQCISRSKITTESKTTSITPTVTSVPKMLNISNKENREDLAISVKKLSRTSNYSSENRKTWKPPHCKSLTGEVKSKPGSFSRLRQPPAGVTRCSTETRNRRDDAGTNKSNVNPNDSTSNTSEDLRASRRSSMFQHQDPEDLHELDFNLPCSSPPPPPPPPSSTPLLLPPSSTPFIPVRSMVRTNSPPGFHAAGHSLSHRCQDKQRHHGVVFNRLVQQSPANHITAITVQMSERSPTRERSFLTDHCNHGNGDGFTSSRKKSEVHFPDLRIPMQPELRAREGKYNRITSREQRKDKAAPSDPQQPD